MEKEIIKLAEKIIELVKDRKTTDVKWNNDLREAIQELSLYDTTLCNFKSAKRKAAIF